MSAPSPEADAALRRVREVCFDFAGTEERLSHGAPWFHVKGRGFVTFASDHHGDGRVAVWVKSTLDEQRRLTRAKPDVYFVPPYVGVKGWVGVRLDGPAADYDALAVLVEEAWASVVPKSLATAKPRPPPAEPAYPTTDPAVAAEAVARVVAFCQTLDGSVMERSGASVTWRVGKKPFAYLLDNHHRDGVVAVCFKLSPDDARALVARAPRRYYAPPYLGHRGWVAMRVDTAKVPWAELGRRVTESYAAAAPRRRAAPP